MRYLSDMNIDIKVLLRNSTWQLQTVRSHFQVAVIQWAVCATLQRNFTFTINLCVFVTFVWARVYLYLLVDFKVLSGISPLAGQNVTSWNGQWIADQEVSITLHQVFCNLRNNTDSCICAWTHVHTEKQSVYSPNISLNLMTVGYQPVIKQLQVNGDWCW